jgi:hypothetical protein
MKRWLLLLCLLLFTCRKAPDLKTSAGPNKPLPDDISSLELQLNQDMLALGLPPSSPQDLEFQPPTTREAATTNLTKEQGLDAQAKTEGRDGYFRNKRTEKEGKKAEQSQCQRTCDLVDNICDAAARICQITAQMPNDPEAPKRCERAQNSCTRAKKQGETCGCSE